MKKIFGVALALVLSVCLICAIAVNASAAVVFTASNESGIAGSEVDVKVAISENTGFGVLQIEVKFDYTKVQLVSFSKNIPLPDDYSDIGVNGTVNKANTTGSIKIKWEPDLIEEGVFSTPLTFEGNALNLKFRILDTNAVGTVIPIELAIKDCYMDNMDMTDVANTVVNGSITVIACDHVANTNTLVETSAPNCTEPGQKSANCSVCGNLITEDIPVEADAHAWGDYSETTPGNCTTPAVLTRVCAHNANHKETKDGEIVADSHAWGDYSETTPGNCTTPAVLTRVCSNNANHKETKDGEIAADNHTWGAWTETTPGNCTTPAVLTRVCSKNANHKETKDGEIVADNHTWGNWTETTPGNCTTPAVLTRVCSNNANHKETKDGEIVADNHAWGNWSPISSGNCVTPPQEERVCANDATHRDTRNGEINSDLHDWNDWTVTNPPSDDTEGEKTRTCKNDPNHVEVVVLSKLNSTFTTEDGSASITLDDVSLVPSTSKLEMLDAFKHLEETDLADLQNKIEEKTGKKAAAVLEYHLSNGNEMVDIIGGTFNIKVPSVDGFENLQYYLIGYESDEFIEVTNLLDGGAIAYDVEEYGILALVVVGDEVATSTPDELDKNPANGDNAAIPYILVATMLAAAAAMVIFKKKANA